MHSSSSRSNTEGPQVIPGKLWVATLCSILFSCAFATILFLTPVRLRESLMAGQSPTKTSLDELAEGGPEDAYNVHLTEIKIDDEPVELGGKALTGLYRFRSTNAREESESPKFFVLDRHESENRDVDLVNELTGVMRRPHQIAYRVGIVPDGFAISKNDWILHREVEPHQRGSTIFVLAISLLVAGFSLALMMNQNWIPNRGISLQVLFAAICLFGWPLRRYRNRKAVRLAYLTGGLGLLAAGWFCVASGDQGWVIGAYSIENWVAAITMWCVGIAMVLYVLLVYCERGSTISSSPPCKSLLSSDERTVQERPFVKLIVSSKSIFGGVAATLFLARIANEIAGQPVDLVSQPEISWALLGAGGIHVLSHYTAQFLARGFIEQSYTPVETVPSRLLAYRNRSADALDVNEFHRVGVFNVCGSLFNTTIDVYLGCHYMVVAEFVSLSGTKATELTSMLESGRSVITTSCDPTDCKPTNRWTDNCYAISAGTSDFDQLLKTHLSVVADLAEREEAAIVVLRDEDAVSLLRYANRAYHNLQVEQGELNDPVGAVRYGRFQFPIGLAESGDEFVDRERDQRIGQPELENCSV